MNRNIFCSRKGGCTIKGAFMPSPNVSQILERQIAKQACKLGHRNWKRLQNGY